VFLGIFGFLVGHEMGHLLLGHGDNPNRSLDEEVIDLIGGSAWESNPPPGPQPARDNGFEDRGEHQPPSASEGGL
jgi:hypothetical protein